jgi:DNA-binding CsgD family transcriptional regulator
MVLFVIQYLIGCYAAFYNVVCVFRLPRGLVHGSKDLYFVMLSTFVFILVTPLAVIFEHSSIHPLAIVESDQVLPFYAFLINLVVLLTLVSKRNWLPIAELTEAYSQNLSNQKYPRQRAKQLLEARFQLTSREREVLHYLLEDLQYKSIAEKMEISPSTAKTHAARIYQKMKITGKNELKAYLASLSS